jgi:hypothetical protein
VFAGGVSWIIRNHGRRDPFSFACQQDLEITLSPEEKKTIEKKIFTNYRNQIKMKLRKEALKRSYPFPEPELDAKKMSPSPF